MKQLNHTQRQIIKWTKLWVNEIDPKKKAFYYRQVLTLNKIYKSKERGG